MGRKRSNYWLGMKVFIYDKQTSDIVEVITDVTNAVSFPSHKLMLVRKGGQISEWDTTKYKITLYQN